MKYLVILLLFLCEFSFAQVITIKGKVLDAENNNPLPNANIIIKNNYQLGTAAEKDGSFTLSGNIDNEDTLIVSYIGYEKKIIPLSKISLNENLIINLVPEIIPSQTVFVEGSLGKKGITPIAFDKIKRKEIQEDYTVQDIPKYLSKLPSTTFYSENGNGIGYNYLSIRGFDQRRISVSINGIPQNDPEDHNVYWLDFPDILASTEMIQVQRGAGSGVSSYPAIGGSINIITSNFTNDPHINVSSSVGSYNTRKYSASFSSGLMDGKYSIYGKLSQILSSGYRNSAWVKFNSYYLSAVRYDKNLTTQINLFGGPIEDGLAYTGLPKFTIKNKDLRRANYSYWETNSNSYTYNLLRRPTEIEHFSQPHYELLNELKLNDNVKINSALFLVLGDGYFDYDGSWADTSYLRLTSEYGFHPAQNPNDVLIRAMVENTQFGWIPRLSFKHHNGELIVGAELRKHKSNHWGSINYGENLPIGLTKDYRYYFFNGGKDIINGFAHETYNLNSHINLLGEIQIAYHKYRLYNEKFIGTDFSVANTFFNPRFGINYKINKEQNVFVSFARVSREPRLNNYYDAAESSGGAVPQFQTKVDTAGNVIGYNFDIPLVKPETMNDIELGTSFTNNDFTINLNLFYMIFDNEIVKNGQVDRFGQPITGNVDQTIHKGIELSGNANFTKSFSIYANATYSSNKIQSGKQYLSSNEYLDLSGNSVSGFPDFLASFGLSYNNYGFYLSLSGRYVGKFYSDNYDNKIKQYLNEHPGFISYSDNINEAYFVSDAFVSYEINLFGSLNKSKVYFQVNNIFDTLYSANAIGPEFFPAAERNFLAGIKLGL